MGQQQENQIAGYQRFMLFYRILWQWGNEKL
jgi:hypothetical protein